MANENSLKKCIGSFFKNLSDGVDNLTLEARLEGAFKNTEGNQPLDIYQPKNLMAVTYYGSVSKEEKKAKIYCSKNTKIEYSSILVMSSGEKYYILDSKEIDIPITLTENSSSHVSVHHHYGLELTLDPEVKEVKAIRVNGKYYLLKEEK